MGVMEEEMVTEGVTTPTTGGATTRALPGKPTRSNSSISRKVVNGEPGGPILSMPSSLPQDGKTILAQEWVMKVETEEPWALEDPGEGWISFDRQP